MPEWGMRLVMSLGFVLGLMIVRAIVHGGFRVQKGRNLSALVVFTAGVRVMLGTLSHVDLLGPFHPLTGAETVRAVNGVLALWVLILVIQFLEPFLFAWMVPASRRKSFPTILRDMVRVFLMIIVVMSVLKTGFGVGLGHLLTTSAILSAVIGLALQSTLNNILAGITIFVEKPFEVGDWIGLGDREGMVDQMSWRATRIWTRDNDYVVVPNSVLAEGQLVNYTKPAQLHREHFPIGVSYSAPPNKVKKVLLEIARDASRHGIMPDPPPEVLLRSYDDFSIEYDLRFWIEDFRRRDVIQDAVRSRVWYYFRRHGIEIPFPIRDVVLRPLSRKDSEDRGRRQRTEILDALRHVSILQPLADEDLERLVPEVLLQSYASGENLVVQDDSGDCFYIILKGRAGVFVLNDRGIEIEVATLSRHDHFGEMSLLTGEARNATVRAAEDCIVAVVSRDAFKHVIESNTAILEALTEIVHARLETNRQRLAASGKAGDELPPERDKGWVRSTMENLLGVGLLRGLTRKGSGGNVEPKGSRSRGGDG
ncbi:mechanosensitive ion channel [Candidatus Fermentibacteria bacterium]|nr:mechanosensitive ion channel [Candidatus Fermentibacteria bacterium]